MEEHQVVGDGMDGRLGMLSREIRAARVLSGSQSVRSSVEAPVMGVERRERRKMEARKS